MRAAAQRVDGVCGSAACSGVIEGEKNEAPSQGQTGAPCEDTADDSSFDSDEPWEDSNGNGRFDAVWLAGFHNRRPARGVHDDLWARAMVLDDGRTRVAIVSQNAARLLVFLMGTSGWGRIGVPINFRLQRDEVDVG